MLQLYPDQVQLLLDAFKHPPQTREEGIYFDDRQFKCVRADKTSIYGKCVSLCKIRVLLNIAVQSAACVLCKCWTDKAITHW